MCSWWIPPDGVFASVLDLFHRLDHLHHTLVDPQLTSVRLVLNPEKMVVAEVQRTYTYLSLFGYPTDLVVANRIVPSDVIDPYFAAWKDAQAAQLRKIREGFQPLPVKNVPLFGTEVVGLEALCNMATAAFGAGDPTERFSEGRMPTIELTSPHSYHFLSHASRRLCSFRVVPVSAAGSLQRGANNQAFRTAIQTEASGVCVN
jgi:arsenite-transporting ATPase